MVGCKAYPLLILVLCALQIDTLPRVKSQQVVEYQRHVKSVEKFSCRTPPPRAVPVSLLVDSQPSEIYTPTMTVLHRCDGGAGCCPMGMSCQPRLTEDVELVFHVSVIRNEVWKRDRGEYRTVSVTNHTDCGCVDIREEVPR